MRSGEESRQVYRTTTLHSGKLEDRIGVKYRTSSTNMYLNSRAQIFRDSQSMSSSKQPTTVLASTGSHNVDLPQSEP